MDLNEARSGSTKRILAQGHETGLCRKGAYSSDCSRRSASLRTRAAAMSRFAAQAAQIRRGPVAQLAGRVEGFARHADELVVVAQTCGQLGHARRLQARILAAMRHRKRRALAAVLAQVRHLAAIPRAPSAPPGRRPAGAPRISGKPSAGSDSPSRNNACNSPPLPCARRASAADSHRGKAWHAAASARRLRLGGGRAHSSGQSRTRGTGGRGSLRAVGFISSHSGSARAFHSSPSISPSVLPAMPCRIPYIPTRGLHDLLDLLLALGPVLANGLSSRGRDPPASRRRPPRWPARVAEKRGGQVAVRPSPSCLAGPRWLCAQPPPR